MIHTEIISSNSIAARRSEDPIETIGRVYTNTETLFYEIIDEERISMKGVGIVRAKTWLIKR
jgi:hypothetical protein